MHAKITRRHALQTLTALTAAAASGAMLPSLKAQPAAAGPFTLEPLPYPADALEPHLDAATMMLHHDRHHQAYVNNLNKALAAHDALARKSIEDLVRDLATVPETIRTAVRNNGGGHYNHDLFWRTMKKGGGGQPRGALAGALEKKFGGFDKFQEAITDAAMKVFGSGWAWLTLDGKELKIESTPNQDSPLTQGRTPLLGIDVWEHAYYLKYQNRRADYVKAFFNVIDWDFVAARFARQQG
jgi:Fe-Mn family superoxide dismutase